MTRLPQVTGEDIPAELQYVWDRLGQDGAVPNIFRAMGNNPKLLRNYLRLGNGLWTDCGLDVSTRELVILRVAYLVRSTYEWHQHVRIARAAGVSDEKIRALHNPGASKLLSEAERALLAYVEAVVESEHPRQPLHDALAAHFPPSTVVGVNLLAGYYVMTAHFLGAMEVQTETPFVGWQLEGSG